MTSDTDVLIAGGGLNGAALALALASGGLSVTVVDPAPVKVRKRAGFDGRSYALALASKRVLAALGLWEALKADAQPMLEIKVSDGRAGEGASPFVLEFDHAELDEGPMGYMVEDRHLRPALLAALEKSDGITRVDGLSVTDHSAGAAGVEVTLSNAQTLTAACLVAADGRESPTRSRTGIGRVAWGYGQTALVCAIGHTRDHGGIAHQFFMPAGPLAVLPLKGRRSSIVWTERAGRAEEINALDDTGYLDVLRPRFGSFLGDIDLAGARFTYPLGLSLAHAFVADRVALLGDAAHAVHPIAGQGLNAGLRDVAALAEVLVEAHRRGEDIGRRDVLERYQLWRRFDATALAVATDGFNRLFSNDNSILRLGRDLGLGLVGAAPALRRGFMREAAGLTGALPRLAEGRPL
ncbi:MAG: FAD-dependent monooxygenase [Paracoccaceae bacterium]|nr:FAD-dependent monooxygenase [Paracoccaceae bacterium]